MSILVRFEGAPSMTGEKYDEVLPRIEAAGQFPPDGLEVHVAFVAGGSFRVSEIWDSTEQFEAFGERLMPILNENGVELAGAPRSSRSTTSSSGKPVRPVEGTRSSTGSLR